jgi:type IV secretory pathway TrbL component
MVILFAFGECMITSHIQRVLQAVGDCRHFVATENTAIEAHAGDGARRVRQLRRAHPQMAVIVRAADAHAGAEAANAGSRGTARRAPVMHGLHTATENVRSNVFRSARRRRYNRSDG